MGLRDFWDRLTGSDKVERVEEELEEDQVEEPARVEDYEAMKDDTALNERFEHRLRRGPRPLAQRFEGLGERLLALKDAFEQVAVLVDPGQDGFHRERRWVE